MEKEAAISSKRSILLALAAVMVTVGILWATNRAVTPKESAWADVIAEAEKGGYRIISTEEMRDLYQKDIQNLLLVDTRQEWEFQTGHIAGSLNFPMEPTGWARWRKAKALEKFLGPDKNRHIVFY
ncbi:MAG: rhodanese-like domain-containing protein [Desulfobacterales bacterium]|nr:rhodanese-like domain-containing protein [Desulfobacterales bacterium]